MSNLQDKSWWDDPSEMDKAWQDMHVRLDKAMPQKRKIRGLLWWLSGAAALITLGLAFYWLYPHSSANTDAGLVVTHPFKNLPAEEVTKNTALDPTINSTKDQGQRSDGFEVTHEPLVSTGNPALQTQSRDISNPPNRTQHLNRQQSTVVASEMNNLPEIVPNLRITNLAEERVSNEAATLPNAVPNIPPTELLNNAYRNPVFQNELIRPYETVTVENQQSKKFYGEFLLGSSTDLQKWGGWSYNAELQWSWRVKQRWSLASGLGYSAWFYDPVISQYKTTASSSGVNDVNQSTVSEAVDLRPQYLQIPVNLSYLMGRHWQVGIGFSYSYLVKGQVASPVEFLDVNTVDPSANPDFASPNGRKVATNSVQMFNSVWTGNARLRYQFNRWIIEGYFKPGITPFREENAQRFFRQEAGLHLGLRF